MEHRRFQDEERRGPDQASSSNASSVGSNGKSDQKSDPFAERMTQDAFVPKLPNVTLPSSGGAIRGLGEKFSVAASTGGGTFSIPLPFSAARMTPGLRLSYDSGSGNGVFGFGWTLDAGAIRRKTDKGLPQYDDAGESDVYVLFGAEDLVPALDAKGARKSVTRKVFGVDYRIDYYRPRIEGQFGRIERWRDFATGVVHWRAISRDNVVTLFGDGPDSRIADPADSSRIFEWRVSRVFDDRGNATFYVYAHDDGAGAPAASAHEANRRPAARKTQTYLRKILYGNRTPYFIDFNAAAEPPSPPPKDWMFVVSIDHGDHPGDDVDPDGVWALRPDPFSTYRAGFEIRTYRRVERVLFFNNFPDQPSIGAYGLVRSLDFVYSDQTNQPNSQSPVHTFLTSITQTGYRRDADGLHTKSLPPLEFDYSRATFDPAVRSIEIETLGDLPEGVDGSRFRWLDLDGEGLSGVFAATQGAWYYKRNLGAANLAPQPDGSARAVPKFGPMREVCRAPAHRDAGGRHLLALDGDGVIDVVALSGAEPGFYTRDDLSGFAPLKRFESLPQIDWGDPNLKFIDLTGDGLADVLVTEDGLFTFYGSLGAAGFDVAKFVRTPWDEERGPKIVFADGSDTMFIADMSGDGLNDIVRVRNGETCYWPNLGYGRFGAKVTMDGAPRFASDEAFDARRIRLADIDGSGTADILYLGGDGVRAWFNQSGNAFSAANFIAVFPAADALESVQVVDLLGTGTACLVWSSPLPSESGAPLRYVDLMGSVKPHLVIAARNNLGAETRVTYAPSTRFYLEDEAAGRPWVTRLAFPVWTVARVETFDRIGRNRHVARYAYHHGFFDGFEREFRGFGMVEQWDTEEFREDEQFAEGDFANWSAPSSTPPILTRTWLHTGAFIEAGKVSRQYESEYWLEPTLRGPPVATGPAAMLLGDSVLPDGLTPFELREAYRALKGHTLRVEVFDGDQGPLGNPYSVVESSFSVQCLQGRGPNPHACFFVHPRESVTLQYERGASDPRVAHEATIEVNAYGEVLRALSIAYPRRSGPAPEPQLDVATQERLAYDQARLHMRGFARVDTNALDDLALAPDIYRAPRAAAADLGEITGVAPKDKGFGAASLFAFGELDGPAAAPGIWQIVWSGAHDIAYENIPRADVDGAGSPAAGPTRRFLAKTRTLYRSDDLSVLLPPGQIESRALPGETYQAALTPGQVAAVFGSRVDDSILQEGGYVRLPGEQEWWAPSGRVYFSPTDGAPPAQELAFARAHFFVPLRLVDPFGGVTRVGYDADNLLAVSLQDAVGNVTICANDYRVLAPVSVTDPNGNRTEAAFDALGLVVATAVGGKPSENLGDLLTGFTIDLDDATTAAFFADPLAAPSALIGQATTRVVMDIGAFYRTRSSAQPSPPAVAVISRESHSADLAGGGVSAYQFAIGYSDGFGRVAQNKARAADGPLVEGGPILSPRWIASGWAVFNNKGMPVRRYEPVFTATSVFEFAVQSGVSVLNLHDPVGRIVATLYPDSSWEKTIHGAWRQEFWDRNDTVAIDDPRNDTDVGPYFLHAVGSSAFTSWRAARIAGIFGADAESKAAEQDAATKASAHAATPTVAHFDSLGRACLAIVDNGGGARFASRTALDTESKALAVFDALGRRPQEHVMRTTAAGGGLAYVAGADMGGRGLYRINADSGERRTLNDIAGRPIRGWDARGQAFWFVYDAARRATRRYVNVASAPKILLDLTIYGEGRPDANLCGRVFRRYDGAGYVENRRHDFKGNLVASARQLAAVYKQSPDWSPLAALTDGAALDVAAKTAGLIPSGDGARDLFVGSSIFDALNRMVQAASPANPTMRPNVARYGFDAGGQLTTIDVWLQQAAAPASLLDPPTADKRIVVSISYNARGQRASIAYGDGVATTCIYDPLTFRLTRLTSLRPSNIAAGERTVQDMRYFYDPVGNVTRLRDDADIQNLIYFRNQRVEPSSDYTYDPLHRLISASGREHLGQTNGALGAPAQISDDDSFRTRLSQPGDGNAMGNYIETYAYDAVGNILSMTHHVASGGWRRLYSYDEASRVDAGETGNRLSATSLPGDPAGGPFAATYDHDAHGNITRMPHLQAMAWSEDDHLRATTRTVGGATPPTTFYAYDSGGARVRKVVENQTGRRSAERVYLGETELYREFKGDGTTIDLARETFHCSAGGLVMTRIEQRTAGNDAGLARQTRYQFSNHLNSATLELGDAGEVLAYEEYFPFGATSYQAVASQSDVARRYRFTGKERNEENGLYYHGARYYAPWLGRWTACDAQDSDSKSNLYLYVNNNPVVKNDPDGQSGVKFNLSDEDDANLSAATKAMADRMSSEFQNVFGIATEVRPITKKVSTGGCGVFNIGASNTIDKTIGYEIVLSTDSTKMAAADQKWQQILQKRRDITAKTVDKGTDPEPISSSMIGQMNKMRDYIKSFLSTDHSVKMTSDGDVAIGAFHTNESRTSVEGNPYTWFVKSGGAMVDPMQYGSALPDPAIAEVEKSKVRLVWGPTMLFVHEMEHITGKMIKGAALPGAALKPYEEDDVMRDVDEFAGAHPDLTQRGQYSVGPEKYTITAEVLPSGANKTPTTSPAAGHAWVKWPSQDQLSKGVK